MFLRAVHRGAPLILAMGSEGKEISRLRQKIPLRIWRSRAPAFGVRASWAPRCATRVVHLSPRRVWSRRGACPQGPGIMNDLWRCASGPLACPLLPMLPLYHF